MTAQALAAAGVLGGGFAFLVLIVILFLILVSNIKIIPQAKAAIVERRRIPFHLEDRCAFHHSLY